MSSPGTVRKILNKIKEAAVPSKFTSDYLSTVLGFKGGNARTFISWAKRCGLLNSDGTPSELYKSFRNPNPNTSGAALATALKKGYEEVFRRNEFAYKLNDSDFKGHLIEITGSEPGNRVVEAIFQTWTNAKALANFEAAARGEDEKPNEGEEAEDTKDEGGTREGLPDLKGRLGLNYTINLVLPKTDDPKIHSAIFKALRENLL